MRRRWLAPSLLLICLGFSIGCNPATFNLLPMLFTDDKLPPEYKLTEKDKEVTVAVMTAFVNPLDVRPEVARADTELAEKVIASLRKRGIENKEKLKLLTATQVRGLQNRHGGLDMLSAVEVGKQLKADYVILLEITSISLYEKNSYPPLFRGNADLTVNLFDVSKPEGERKVFDKLVRVQYPENGPIDTSGSGDAAFRASLIAKIANDLTKTFLAYPPDERFSMR